MERTYGTKSGRRCARHRTFCEQILPTSTGKVKYNLIGPVRDLAPSLSEILFTCEHCYREGHTTLTTQRLEHPRRSTPRKYHATAAATWTALWGCRREDGLWSWSPRCFNIRRPGDTKETDARLSLHNSWYAPKGTRDSRDYPRFRWGVCPTHHGGAVRFFFASCSVDLLSTDYRMRNAYGRTINGTRRTLLQTIF